MTTPPATNPDGLTAPERLALAMGRPAPALLSEAELEEFERAQDRADKEAARFYAQGIPPVEK